MDLTDEALIDKYRESGDMSVFKTLIRRYQSRVYSIAFRVLGNSEEAEEIVQDCFLKVHQNMDKYQRKSTFSSWLFRIAHNLCMDSLRLKQRRKDMTVISFDPQAAAADEEIGEGAQRPVTQLPDMRPTPSQTMDNAEEIRVLEESLSLLPESQKSVLLLHDIQGFSYQEIAEITSTSIGTVRSRLHYGRIKLKELLDPYFSPESLQNPDKTQPAKSR